MEDKPALKIYIEPLFKMLLYRESVSFFIFYQKSFDLIWSG